MTTEERNDHDVIVIGAGFAGLYQLIRLRQAGYEVRVLEAGADVGGTWYWNRYPGARCDVESIEYSYSFDRALEQEWNWTERYASQPEILDYIRHVAERYDLRRDITFETCVEAMRWDNVSERWTVRTDDGRSRTARFVIAATGCLSVPSRPDFAGMADFAGELYWTSNWPHDGVDLAGKRVAVVGTGSSGLQTITAIAPVVGSLTVFQRTPSYAVPAHNGPISSRLDEVKPGYAEFREESRLSRLGFHCGEDATGYYAETPADGVRRELERRWSDGGLCFTLSFRDVLFDAEANEALAEYVRERIREKVHDPVTAEKLTPRSYPIGAKRMCVDTGYFEVYNRDNVSLVDLGEEPIERFTERGIVAGDAEREFDVIILATGFDAMTGALTAMDVRGTEGTLSEKWAAGPRTYLGLMTAGFPNLFMITGPQSPSVLSNMMTSIEYHVDWITRALEHLRTRGSRRMEPVVAAEDNWVNTTNDVGDLTLMPRAASWYMGANIPGKQRVFMPFVGGVGTYKQIGDGVAVAGYHGFELT
ncbi:MULTISPECIES: flavin-containing monooxygenase [Prauserella salsuginis group]|uniref:Flavin-containing monooxygenase n=1 Tax=Prauserella salsuginis TaxID=387889 RepID=A0ABW6G1P7_9PSEU|nr:MULTISPECIES: NAD(P)/FAD-dependent oxidoreductase [Prauserella salsuginis group]MCR3722246.1 cyclohexanone monooxygenase [Prauserella flava]MCR3736244.1 cyclohexanone monooxygenase [Prauserella salsuginis]